jgi:hypothetical protein
MKKKQSRDKAAPVQEKELAWVKGSSGYNVVSGEEEPPPTGGGG